MPSPGFSLSRRFPRILLLFPILALAAVTLNLSLPSQAQTEAVIYSFPGAPGPGSPAGGLVFDAAGNLYGTTLLGGAHNLGTLYELSPVSAGGWRETTIHSFTGGDDGGNPASSLVFDASGNLYGTTSGGGTKSSGTVFEFSPLAGGGWHESVLHSLNGRDEGWLPLSGLVIDSAGNLYGAASMGGTHGWGTVFELSQAAGIWSFAVIFSFGGGGEGGTPEAALVLDSAGYLYGTTARGGNNECPGGGSCGLVFQLSPSASGPWNETILHAFRNTDGAMPISGVVFDQSGNLYGATYEGGNTSKCSSTSGNGCGVVFELAIVGNNWEETILHAFTGGQDGGLPGGGVILDVDGHPYGTTETGGDTTTSGCNPGGCGEAFELTHPTGGHWDQVALHDFTQFPDGASPVGSLIFDSFGNVYGTTAGGGAFGSGTVFEITP
jgi:uncharacterized repeat protein (TIGR03803 family)